METYSLGSDFGGVSPNIEQLVSEIQENVNITTTLNSLYQYSDDVNIVFASSISGPEKTELDSIVANHVPVYIPSTDKKLNIRCNNDSKKSSYTRVGISIFLGSTYATAKCISYMDSGATSYDIQIYDKDNHQVLLTKNLTNTEESVQDLGVLTNLSTSPSQIEVLVKRNGSGSNKVYIETLTICYN